jgi:hypothetical protein
VIPAIRIATEAATLGAAPSSQVVELRCKGELLFEADHLLSEGELLAEEPRDIVEACTARNPDLGADDTIRTRIRSPLAGTAPASTERVKREEPFSPRAPPSSDRALDA